MIHLEVHGVQPGKPINDLMHLENGLKAHLKRSGVKDAQVTAISSDEERGAWPDSYLRIYYDDQPPLSGIPELIAVIRKYPGMYQYRVQVMPKLEQYNPPIHDGHLP